VGLRRTPRPAAPGDTNQRGTMSKAPAHWQGEQTDLLDGQTNLLDLIEDPRQAQRLPVSMGGSDKPPTHPPVGGSGPAQYVRALAEAAATDFMTRSYSEEIVAPCYLYYRRSVGPEGGALFVGPDRPEGFERDVVASFPPSLAQSEMLRIIRAAAVNLPILPLP